MKIHDHRKQYSKDQLGEDILPDDPFVLFTSWFEMALKQHAHEANAMVLSTVFENKPSARVVLLKEVSCGGFVFFSNYKSRKGEQLALNPNACLTFFYPDMEKQIRIEGTVSRINKDDSKEYFDSRPLLSRISAIVSPQSTSIESRQELELERNKYLEMELPIIRPSYWGGYRLIPESIEFWQGREDRLHDRILYTKTTKGWQRNRLAP
ncbi:MAG: pyridoxamine 5'-phosphate oxidase [Bacteroidetes bacterium HGW-Bacteroidetes-1]|jgi:pyridoxamine 5'-phosphate oxidase|nr:MAG: pyridoxamine 5'-phosphate oxidase [Bacteroidetes bacterium HGW-Bacteroidetes-1]